MSSSMRVVTTNPTVETLRFAWNIGKFDLISDNWFKFQSKPLDVVPFCCRIHFSIDRKLAHKNSLGEESDSWVYTIKSSRTPEKIDLEEHQYQYQKAKGLNVTTQYIIQEGGRGSFSYHYLDTDHLEKHMKEEHKLDHVSCRQYLIGRNGHELHEECGNFVDDCTYSFEEGSDFFKTDCLEFRLELLLFRLSDRVGILETTLNNPKDFDTDLTGTLNSGNFSDLTIESNGRFHPAHKLVLASRSPVFEAMLSKSWKEGVENVVRIETKVPETMERFLQFMYSGRFDESETGPTDLKMELIGLAEQYDIPRLKFLCELSLMRCLSVDTIFDVLKIADIHSAENLRDKCLLFLRLNRSTLSERPEIAHIVTTYSEGLRKEVLKKLYS